MWAPTCGEALGQGLRLSLVVDGKDADCVLRQGGQVPHHPGPHKANIHLQSHFSDLFSWLYHKAKTTFVTLFLSSHLIGLDSVGLDVHDAVASDLPGGGVPGQTSGAVVHVGEAQVHRRAQRHWGGTRCDMSAHRLDCELKSGRFFSSRSGSTGSADHPYRPIFINILISLYKAWS